MNNSRSHLAAIIGARSLAAPDMRALAQEIAAYLLDSGHIGELESLMRDIMAYRVEHGVVEVTAVSANPLSAKDIADVKAILKHEYPHAKSFIVDQQQVPEVIGGVMLNLPGEQLDLTVRAKVNKFKRLTSSGKGV